MPTPFDIFKEELLRAAGDTVARRGYTLDEDAVPIRSGLYRFAKAAQGALALIDVQLLFYAGGGPSRFEVKVWRTDRPANKVRLGVWLRERGVDTRADAAGWWEFVSADALSDALQDAASGLERMMNAEG